MANLSDFQKEKLLYYFKYFDFNGDGTIDAHDVPLMQEKILKFTGWDANSMVASHCEEVHREFVATFLNRAKSRGSNVITEDVWLEVWADLLRGGMGMQDFPVWLQLLPKVLFEIVDRDGDGDIGKEELLDFYENFVHVDKNTLADLGSTAYDQMTDIGNYALDINLYVQIFANFLLGRNDYGPGKFIFGCFAIKHKPFKLDLSNLKYGDTDDSTTTRGHKHWRPKRTSSVPQIKLRWN